MIKNTLEHAKPIDVACSNFDIKTTIIHPNRAIWSIEAFQNLEFRHTIGVLDPADAQIDICVL